MNKDYLTSSFNDENFKKLFKTAKVVLDSLENTGIFKTELVPKETSKIISKKTLIIIDSLKPIAESTITIDKLIKTNPDILKSTVKSVENIVNSPLFSSYSKLNIPSLHDIDLSNMLTAFESFIEDNPKYRNQYPENSRSKINTKSEENIIIKSNKVDDLNIAFINFKFNSERFKEVFHKSYSFASERRVVTFNVIAAFVYLVECASYVHPSLPVWIFSIISLIALFIPKEK